MDLNQRFNVLAQGVMVAQKNGNLSLDEAVEAKKRIETIQNGDNLKESLHALINICEATQKKGSYTLEDAHILFMAIDGIDDEIEKFINENNKQGEAVEEPKEDQKPEAVVEEPNQEEVPQETKKGKKKSK